MPNEKIHWGEGDRGKKIRYLTRRGSQPKEAVIVGIGYDPLCLSSTVDLLDLKGPEGIYNHMLDKKKVSLMVN